MNPNNKLNKYTKTNQTHKKPTHQLSSTSDSTQTHKQTNQVLLSIPIQLERHQKKNYETFITEETKKTTPKLLQQLGK